MNKMSASSTTYGKPSFLISDILKQNKTKIVCRKNSSPEISQMSQSSGNFSDPKRNESLQYGCEMKFAENLNSSEFFSIDCDNNNVHYITGILNYFYCDKLFSC